LAFADQYAQNPMSSYVSSFRWQKNIAWLALVLKPLANCMPLFRYSRYNQAII